ncbi:MAG TPA: hypothetical protein VFV67_09345 [Actinophytocola sp.]|uniref:hypothetical protein n=1 Tax=Actinophytocola sp. TaxID=1872138 RepID=UPI002DBF30A9|nr:hypothetical protein [Actinophytocola sp.]HEU5470845.1 hypothetical protein [Actinophytocola sp.]
MRQYRRGRPTGVVAMVAWDSRFGTSPRPVAHGPDVWMVLEPRQLTIAERTDQGHGQARLYIPLRSCSDVALLDEPGLHGSSLVRLTLTVRIGQGPSFTLPLWFPTDARPVLEDLARRVRTQAPPSSEEPTRPSPKRTWTRTGRTVPLLEVEAAPDDADWVVFRPSVSSAEVLIPRSEVRPG